MNTTSKLLTLARTSNNKKELLTKSGVWEDLTEHLAFSKIRIKFRKFTKNKSDIYIHKDDLHMLSLIVEDGLLKYILDGLYRNNEPPQEVLGPISFRGSWVSFDEIFNAFRKTWKKGQ
jgi:hypothetical protein